MDRLRKKLYFGRGFTNLDNTWLERYAKTKSRVGQKILGCKTIARYSTWLRYIFTSINFLIMFDK